MNLADVQKLAKLARVEMSEEEMTSVAHDMDGILGYIDQIKNASTSDLKVAHDHINSVREDVATNDTGTYTKALEDQFPGREGDYLKVKQIM